MNAEHLLRHFETIGEAPDGIVRLRHFILDLAVRGKLVQQEAPDEPGSELLKRLRQERARLEKLKAIKRIKLQYGPISLDRDFELPAKWVTATVGETCDLQTGATPDRNRPEFFGGDIRWLVSGDINQGEIFDCDGRITQLGLDSSNCKILPQNCVLIALNGQGKTRATVALLRTQAACNQSLVAIIPLLASDLTPEYLHLSLKARYVAIRELTGKDERRGLNMRLLECFEIAIPPIAEQRRIVDRVGELMGLCDQLEAARAGREVVRDRLAAASLARLNAPDPETFEAGARFALDALPALTTRPDQIKALRQTILNLAVRGKVVPQDAEDEPASELLKRIAAENMQMLSTKGIRLQKPAPPAKNFEFDSEIPSTWCHAYLQDIAYQITDGTHLTPKYTEVGKPFLSAQNVKPFRFKPDKHRFVSEADFDSYRANRRPERGDILMTRVGAGIGEAAVLDSDFEFAFYVSLCLIKIPSRLVSADYLVLWLNSPEGRQSSTVRTYGKGASQGNLNLGLIRTFKIPLPPLAEQHRIVAKVDALMALCDRLEISLTEAAATRGTLLDALLAEALAPVDAFFASADEQATVELAKVGSENVVFVERSAFILSLAYERHRIAQRERTFGHVKAQKILHLVEAVAGFDLGRLPIRDAAGPNDFKHMLAVEKWARENERFVFETNGTGYLLRRLSDFSRSLTTEHGPDDRARVIITKLIDLFVAMDTRQAEIFATVYSAWNNLLVEGKSPTDKEVVWAARDDWHTDKLKLPEGEFFSALNKLRVEGLVPKGTGKFVDGPHQKTLFN